MEVTDLHTRLSAHGSLTTFWVDGDQVCSQTIIPRSSPHLRLTDEEIFALGAPYRPNFRAAPAA
jgi:hypothetical protein